jgi:hypothetical protein
MLHSRPSAPLPLPLRLSTPSSLSLDFFLRAGFNDLNTVAGRNRPLIQHSGTTLSFRWRTGLQTGREAWCLFFYPGGGGGMGEGNRRTNSRMLGASSVASMMPFASDREALRFGYRDSTMIHYSRKIVTTRDASIPREISRIEYRLCTLHVHVLASRHLLVTRYSRDLIARRSTFDSAPRESSRLCSDRPSQITVQISNWPLR